MKKTYGDKYACIAQTVYQDTVKAFLGHELERRELLLPSQTSLEAVFSKSGIKYGYIDANELDDIVKIRTQGAGHNQSINEDYIKSKDQIQGVLFIN